MAWNNLLGNGIICLIKTLFWLVLSWQRKIVYLKKVKKKVFILSLYGRYFTSWKWLGVNWLSFIFEIKDMSQADYVFGIKIQRDRCKSLLSFSQETYIERILECFCMYNSKTINTLIKNSHIFNTKHCSKIE